MGTVWEETVLWGRYGRKQYCGSVWEEQLFGRQCMGGTCLGEGWRTVCEEVIFGGHGIGRNGKWGGGTVCKETVWDRRYAGNLFLGGERNGRKRYFGGMV